MKFEQRTFFTSIKQNDNFKIIRKYITLNKKKIIKINQISQFLKNQNLNYHLVRKKNNLPYQDDYHMTNNAHFNSLILLHQPHLPPTQSLPPPPPPPPTLSLLPLSLSPPPLAIYCPHRYLHQFNLRHFQIHLFIILLHDLHHSITSTNSISSIFLSVTSISFFIPNHNIISYTILFYHIGFLKIGQSIRRIDQNFNNAIRFDNKPIFDRLGFRV